MIRRQWKSKSSIIGVTGKNKIKHSNETKLIFKTIIQENFLETRENLNLTIERAHGKCGTIDSKQWTLWLTLTELWNCKEKLKIFRFKLFISIRKLN